MSKKSKSQKSKSDIPTNKAIIMAMVILAIVWYAYENPVTVGVWLFIGMLVAGLAVAAFILWQIKGTALGALLKLK